MRDPYEVLGVDRKASEADIKSAFRRMAKKLHPDANKTDPKAASRFAELNAAYEILGEEDKRKAFDRGEIDAEGKPRFQGFEGFGAGAGRGQSGFAPESEFETFNFGPEGFTRSNRRGRGAGYGGFEDILREAFDYSYLQIADILQMEEANARQLVSRARKHIVDGRRTLVSASQQQRLLDVFVVAAQKGEMAALENLLAQDVVAYACGAGIARADDLQCLGAAA